jgi:hypothetical protein
MRSSQVHNEIGSSTETNVLSGRYKENDFIIKSGMEIDKNVKLQSLSPKPSKALKALHTFEKLYTLNLKWCRHDEN